MIVGVEPFGHLLRWRTSPVTVVTASRAVIVALRAARHREIGRESDSAAVPAVDIRNGANHHTGVEHMVVERELVGGDYAHPKRFLACPIGGAQSGGCLDQLRFGGFAGPVAFERKFQLTPRTDARCTQCSNWKIEKRHSFNPMVWGQRHGGCVQRTPPEATSAWRTTGTPRPWTYNVVGAGLLARGSSLLSRL